MIRSWDSSNLSRFSLGSNPACRVSVGLPRTKPEMRRPLEYRSSMAISSAILMGSLMGSMLPRMAIFTLLVILAMTAASRLAEGFMFQ